MWQSLHVGNYFFLEYFLKDTWLQQCKSNMPVFDLFGLQRTADATYNPINRLPQVIMPMFIRRQIPEY